MFSAPVQSMVKTRRFGSDFYKLALPLDSKGKINTRSPAAMNRAPLTYTGALVWRSANMATIGAMMPKILFADAVIALPVPRSLVGKISGVYEYLKSQSSATHRHGVLGLTYRTAYMMLLMKL
jgi:hypothetical protein